VSDPLDNTTVFGYEDSSLLPNTVQLPTPDRPAITIGRNTKGQPTTITDPAIPDALPIGMGFTAANRVDWVTDEAGRLLDADYDPVTNDLTKLRRYLDGTPVETGYGYQNGYLHTITDPRNMVWTIGRDAYGRVTDLIDPTTVTIHFDYDALGRLWRISDPRLSSPITYTFDDLDRIETVTTPAGTTTYHYDPITKWLQTMTDVENRTVTFEHDPANGDITKAVYAMPQQGGGTVNVTTDYSYTRFGDLQTVAAPGAQPTTFQIDDLGRLTGTTETDAGIFDAPQGFVSNNANDGTWTKNKNHTFTWGAPESSVPVDGYSFSQDVSAPETVTTTSPTATWNNVADGQHSAHVRAVVFDAQVAHVIMHFFGENSVLEGATLRSNGEAIITVEPGCTGFDYSWFLAAAVAAFPAAIFRRGLGIVAGVAVLLLLNIVRVSSLYWVGVHRPELFAFVHEQLWAVLLNIATVCLMVAWIVWIKRPNET